MSEELRPCPFCGSDHVDLICMGTREDDPHVVECDDCDATASGMDRAEAMANWNRRAGRTCRPEVCDDGAGAWGVYCSECGYRFAGPYGKREVPEHMATRRDIMPRYCPSCGARVVSE